MTARLTIANKAYSSWSFRPWILMTHFGLPFEEVVVPLDQPTTRLEILRHSPTGKLPLLAAEGLLIWDSLAIIEYLAEAHPTVAIWPGDRLARAAARTISAEMHAGFAALRMACPMNMRRPVRAIPLDDSASADVTRIETIWSDTRQAHGQDGPFLFGAFTAADAMFAPIVNRFATYDLPRQPSSRDYMAAMHALPAWQAWARGAEAEPWSIARYEAI